MRNNKSRTDCRDKLSKVLRYKYRFLFASFSDTRCNTVICKLLNQRSRETIREIRNRIAKTIGHLSFVRINGKPLDIECAARCNAGIIEC
uniref:Uncharacterized protein n=1 Tax=Trichogramma kaykai TaxID=54128 RepID=A0ABD2WHI4_9HYME